VTELDFVGPTFANFRDHVFPEDSTHGYRWVDLKSFRFRQGGQDGELLAAVIAHEQFRDDYAGGGVDPDGTRHGPYWLRSVSPEGYQPVSRDMATQTLRRWAWQHGEVPDSLRDVLDAALFTVVNSASRLYRLCDLGSTCFHDWGGVHLDFHEFIAIDEERHSLTLLVAADD
jgi:hypothetical protein